MKNILKRLPKKLYAAIATVGVLALVAPTAFAAFGPDRPTHKWTEAENGFDYVTFNSFTDVPLGIGDERDFYRGVQVGRDSVWSDPVANVENDAEVEMKIYVHNNANPNLNDAAGNPGIAKNVTVRAELPTGTAQSQQSTAYITADNAQPKQIYDTLDVTGANNMQFEMDYIEGSAKMYDHNTGQTTALNDSLVTTGVNIGDQKGCFQYLREITFRVKIKKPRYMTQKTARLNGEGSDKWREVVNAKIGDKVDWRIWFKNAGSTRLANVKVVDTLPSHVSVVPGSIKLYNGNHPNGYTYTDDAVQMGGKQINVDIGNYAAGADAYLVFTTTSNDAEILRCGNHQIANIAYTTPEGFGAIGDDARVNVIGKDSKECAEKKCPIPGKEHLPANSPDCKEDKCPIPGKEHLDKDSAECKETPEVLPSTGPAGLIGLFAATSVAGGVAHNIITRRRAAAN